MMRKICLCCRRGEYKFCYSNKRSAFRIDVIVLRAVVLKLPATGGGDTTQKTATKQLVRVIIFDIVVCIFSFGFFIQKFETKETVL